MADDTLLLKQLTIKGFKSFDANGQTISFNNITVLLGANGAGKSNIISFFKMLNYLTTEGLQTFIAQQGYSNSILHYGPSITPNMEAALDFQSINGTKDTYGFSLSHASGDTLIFTDEHFSWQTPGQPLPQKRDLKAGHSESKLRREVLENIKPSQVILGLLNRCRVFQFHDTSSTAKIRNQGYVNDNEYLRDNAGNLAAFLYAMKSKPEWIKYYDRIVRHIQLVMPQFGDFELKPSQENNDYIRLDWSEKGTSYRFGPHQISDGALRFIALTTLLLQPKETLPNVIILDEPELGLHPAAISSLAGMIRTISRDCQVILATQSPRLVDEFDVKDITIVERDDQHKHSVVKKLDSEALAEWLDRYSISDLWEKNVIGGRPIV